MPATRYGPDVAFLWEFYSDPELPVALGASTIIQLDGFDSEDQLATMKLIDAMIVKQQVQTMLTSLDDKAGSAKRFRRVTTMQPAKQEALETIGKLPDDADMNEIMYRLYVLDKIRKGQKAVKQGHTITSDDLKREIDSW